jgi:hypothetical protein
VQQDIDAFQIAQFADEDEVGGIVGKRGLVELAPMHAVRHDAHRAGRLADHTCVAPRREHAFEDEAVGHRREHALRADINASQWR